MKVKLWDARGSIPTPLSPDQVRGKIAAVVQRIQPSDLGVSLEERCDPAGEFLIFSAISTGTTCRASLFLVPPEWKETGLSLPVLFPPGKGRSGTG